MASRAAAMELLKNICKTSATQVGFAKNFHNLKYVKNDTNRCIFEMKVLDDHCNASMTLHGGAIASLVDIISTWMVTVESGKAGVTVDMNVSYMRAARPGEEILIDTQMLKLGRTTAFMTVDITNKSTGDLIAQGRHTKNISKY